MEKAALKPGTEKALVALSGGPSSSVMLQLLYEYNREEPHKKSKKQVFKSVEVCFIDESAIVGEQGIVENVLQMVQKLNYNFMRIPLEDVFSPDYTISGVYDDVLKITTDSIHRKPSQELFHSIQQQSGSISNRDKLKALLDGASKMTVKEDFVCYLKLSLLLHYAQKKNCTRLFLGDSSTRLAIKTISLTSKGRGFSLPLEIAGEVQWFGDIKVMRPMKDMLSKEIGLYNQFLDLDSVFIPSLTTMLPPKASIERLTEDFIVGLERDYPSTVSTVARTAAKLKPSELMQDEKCIICL
ncbi:956_t:CDS:2, partial [Paraglomus occultum]